MPRPYAWASPADAVSKRPAVDLDLACVRRRGRRWRCPAASTSRIRSRPPLAWISPLRHSMLTSSRACTAPKRLEIPFSERTTGEHESGIGRHRWISPTCRTSSAADPPGPSRTATRSPGWSLEHEFSSTRRSDGLKMISDGIGAPCCFIIAAVSAVRPCVNSADCTHTLKFGLSSFFQAQSSGLSSDWIVATTFERLVGRLERAHRADRGVAVVVAEALEVGVLAQDPGHRLQRALARPVRVRGRDDLDVGVQPLPLALLPCGGLSCCRACRRGTRSARRRAGCSFMISAYGLAERADVLAAVGQVVGARIADVRVGPQRDRDLALRRLAVGRQQGLARVRVADDHVDALGDHAAHVRDRLLRVQVRVGVDDLADVLVRQRLEDELHLEDLACDVAAEAVGQADGELAARPVSQVFFFQHSIALVLVDLGGNAGHAREDDVLLHRVVRQSVGAVDRLLDDVLGRVVVLAVGAVGQRSRRTGCPRCRRARPCPCSWRSCPSRRPQPDESLLSLPHAATKRDHRHERQRERGQ